MKRKLFILSILFILSSVAYGQVVTYDYTDNDGFRNINTKSLSILRPKGSIFPISISINYYEGYLNKYYLRLYSRYPLAKNAYILLTADDGKELAVNSRESTVFKDDLGLIKEVEIYDVLLPVEQYILDEICSSKIKTIEIFNGDERLRKKIRNNDLARWINASKKEIIKALEK